MNVKVLIIGGSAPSLINFRGELIKRFISMNYEVHTAAGESSEEINAPLEKLGVKHYETELTRTGAKPLGDLAYLKSLKKLMKSLQPDLVLAYTIKPVVYGGLAAHSLSIPFFALITGLGYAFMPAKSLKHSLISKVSRVLYKRALKKATHVFFQNSDDRDLFYEQKLLSSSSSLSIVNGSGVDVVHFSEKALPNEMSFLLIARLLKDKGIQEYVEAARVIKEKYSNVSFQILGPFDSNPAAISEVQMDHWQKKGLIEYLGAASDVRPYIEKCRIYVLPSYREGTPRTVLEAMAMGRPIITTNVPGCRQTVADKENGLLVESHNSKSLAEAMEWMIANPEEVKKMGELSRKRAEDIYDVHKVNAQLISTIEEKMGYKFGGKAL